MFNYYYYPHTDLNQANMNWIIQRIKDLERKLQEIEQVTPVDYAVPEQFDSWPEHNTVTQRQLAVLDDSGHVFGGSVNINDVMLKPRRCASGAIGVFDDRGNLIPMSLDENTPVISLKDLAIVADDKIVSPNTQIFHIANGFALFTRKISVTLDNLTAAGGVYRQSVTVNDIFPISFTSTPTVIIAPSDDVNAACWIGAATYTTSQLSRITFFAHQSNSITVNLTYIVIGRKENYTV